MIKIYRLNSNIRYLFKRFIFVFFVIFAWAGLDALQTKGPYTNRTADILVFGGSVVAALVTLFFILRSGKTPVKKP